MSFYYFDVRDGDKVTIDNDGIQLASAEVAWTEAALSIAEMARDAFPKKAEGTDHHLSISVRNQNGFAFSIKAAFKTERDE